MFSSARSLEVGRPSPWRRGLAGSLVALASFGAIAASGADAAPTQLPVGTFSRMVGAGDGAHWILTGSVNDYDDLAAQPSVSVSVDGADVAASVSYGDSHSYTASIAIPAAAGKHYVCVWATDTDGASGATLIGCRTGVTNTRTTTPTNAGTTTTTTPASATPAAKGHVPTGAVTRLVGDRAANTWTVAGYVRDYDTLDQGVALEVRIDGAAVATGTATAPSHLFAVPMTRPAVGRHYVCVYATDTENGAQTLLGCRTGRV